MTGCVCVYIYIYKHLSVNLLQSMAFARRVKTHAYRCVYIYIICIYLGHRL